jgi:multiple sugar transport system substrate-binding protein
MKLTSKRSSKAIIASLAIVALTLSGCASTDSAEPEVPAVTIDDSPATGTIEFWAGGSEGEALPPFIDKFIAENPEVTVNVTAIPAGELDAKLIAAIVAGTVPDMVFTYTQTQRSIFNTGGLAPMPEGLLNPDDFFKAAWDSNTIEGATLAVPWYVYAGVFYYRKDLAEKYGIAAPTTWEGVRDFAKAFQAEGVDKPVVLSTSYDQFSSEDLVALSAQNGGSLLSADNTTWTLNTPENVEALAYWGSLFTDGYVNTDGPDFMGMAPSFSDPAKSVGANYGQWFPSFLDGANGEGWSAKNMGTVVPPAGSAGSFSAIGGGSLAVLKDAKNPEAAWKLIRWMSSPTVQSDWYDLFGNLPTVSEAWSVNAKISSDPLLDAVKAAVATGTYGPQVPNWTEVSNMLGAQMEKVARGTATAQEALEEAQKQAEAIGTGVE